MNDNKKIIIRVSYWYDTVSPESAEAGDYASTGNDFRSFEFLSIRDAIKEINKLIKDYLGHYEGNLGDGDTLSACDPETDYCTGNEDCWKLDVSIDGADATVRHRIRQIIDRHVY